MRSRDWEGELQPDCCESLVRIRLRKWHFFLSLRECSAVSDSVLEWKELPGTSEACKKSPSFCLTCIR